MSDLSVRAALVEGYLAALAPTPPPTEYENTEFTEGDATLWTSVSFHPASSHVATLGDNGEDEDRGFLQIDINIPNASGEKDLMTIAETLKSFFTAGKDLTYNGVTVVIESRKLSPGRRINNWWRRSLTIVYQTRINR